MGEFPEGDCKGEEESGWHDEPELVHWEVVVNSVEEEVEGYCYTIVWKESREMISFV